MTANVRSRATRIFVRNRESHDVKEEAKSQLETAVVQSKRRRALVRMHFKNSG